MRFLYGRTLRDRSSLRARSRCLLTYLLVVCLVHAVLPAAVMQSVHAGGQAAANAPAWLGGHVPVILVHSYHTPQATWGGPGDRRGLYPLLVKHGWIPEQTLFVATHDPWQDPIDVAEHSLLPLLQRAAARSGSRDVDLVVHGHASLAVQHLVKLLEQRPGAPRIRQIIAIAPLWDGHRGIDRLRQAQFRQALLAWHRSTGVGRQTSFTLDHAERLPDFAALRHEQAWIIERALYVYEPLYHRFLLETRFLPSQADAAGAAFWDWLHYQGDALQAVFSEEPPLGAGSGAAGPWSPGHDLSRIYYEVSAWEAARHAYKQLQPLQLSLPDQWYLRIDPSAGFWANVRPLLGELFLQALEQAGPRWLEAQRDAWSLRLAPARMKAAEAFMRRMVPQRLEAALPYGRTAPRANRWLEATALPQGWGRRPLGPRVFQINGRVGGPLALVYDQQHQQSSQAFVQDLDDQTVELRAWFGTASDVLPRHARVQQWVLEALAWAANDDALPGAGDGLQAAQTVDVFRDRPGYWRNPAGRTLVLELTLAEDAGLPRGQTAYAWALAPGGSQRRQLLALTPGVPQRMELLPGERLGMRIATDYGDVIAQALGRGQARVTIRVAGQGAAPAPATPAAKRDGAADGTAGRIDAPESSASGRAAGAVEPQGLPPVAGRPAAGRPDPAGAAPNAPAPGKSGSASAPQAAGLPEIRVILHSKQTTHKEERIVRHAQWEWSISDGRQWIDRDPAKFRTTETILFPVPGHYQVRARSRADDGRILREQTFTVAVAAGQAPLQVALTAETVQPPQVDLQLLGPVEWLVGMPATFQLQLQLQLPPYASLVTQTFDPGEAFVVVWERPGPAFIVRGAVDLTLRYRFPDGDEVELDYTYLAARSVDVLAIGSGGYE